MQCGLLVTSCCGLEDVVLSSSTIPRHCNCGIVDHHTGTICLADTAMTKTLSSINYKKVNLGLFLQFRCTSSHGQPQRVPFTQQYIYFFYVQLALTLMLGSSKICSLARQAKLCKKRKLAGRLKNTWKTFLDSNKTTTRHKLFRGLYNKEV